MAKLLDELDAITDHPEDLKQGAVISVTDVITQSTSLSQAQLDQILTVAAQIMDPHPFTKDGTIILSSVYKQGMNAPVIRWQWARRFPIFPNSMKRKASPKNCSSSPASKI